MKQMLCAALCFILCLCAVTAIADTGISYTFGTAIDDISTRNGPGTQYRDTGTYRLMGERIKILSYYYDMNDVCWLEIEIRYHDKLRRLYTGLKRFDRYSVDLGLLSPHIIDEDEQIPARVIVTSKGKYGPGEEYSTYSNLTVKEGMDVGITHTESEWCEVFFVDKKGVSQMCWVEEDTLLFDEE